MLTLLLGGARSGKSALAQRLGARWPGPVVVVATARPGDEDMAARIARHRNERPAAWTTVEAPLALGAALAGAPARACVIVDCLTLWTANLLGAGRAGEGIVAEAAEVAARAAAREAPTVVVSNEVGLGVHPATGLGREYRDLLGRVNAHWAEAADTALLLVAGRALALDRADDLLT